jgi:NAD(P)-dependent dehydrogenase (short-subunit alcohol dehydrogenase family)
MPTAVGRTSESGYGFSGDGRVLTCLCVRRVVLRRRRIEEVEHMAAAKMGDLTGKVAVVTGGSGGIGAGISCRFAVAGADVVVAYHRNRDGADRVVEAISEHGSRAVGIQVDVTEPADVQRLVASSLDAFGAVDVLINNAGAYPMASILDMTADEWDRMLSVNLRSTFLCLQAVAKVMVERGSGGSIVNVASIEAENPAPMHAHYCASKAAVVMLTQSAAAELGPHRIRVNCVSPGLIHREGIEEAWPEGVERWANAAPLERLGTPSDVANACLFLASPAAEWITGANLRVDGGVMTHQVF